MIFGNRPATTGRDDGTIEKSLAGLPSDALVSAHSKQRRTEKEVNVVFRQEAACPKTIYVFWIEINVRGVEDSLMVCETKMLEVHIFSANVEYLDMWFRRWLRDEVADFDTILSKDHSVRVPRWRTLIRCILLPAVRKKYEVHVFVKLGVGSLVKAFDVVRSVERRDWRKSEARLVPAF